MDNRGSDGKSKAKAQWAIGEELPLESFVYSTRSVTGREVPSIWYLHSDGRVETRTIEGEVWFSNIFIPADFTTDMHSVWDGKPPWTPTL